MKNFRVTGIILVALIMTTLNTTQAKNDLQPINTSGFNNLNNNTDSILIARGGGGFGGGRMGGFSGGFSRGGDFGGFDRGGDRDFDRSDFSDRSFDRSDVGDKGFQMPTGKVDGGFINPGYNFPSSGFSRPDIGTRTDGLDNRIQNVPQEKDSILSDFNTKKPSFTTPNDNTPRNINNNTNNRPNNNPDNNPDRRWANNNNNPNNNPNRNPNNNPNNNPNHNPNNNPNNNPNVNPNNKNNWINNHPNWNNNNNYVNGNTLNKYGWGYNQYINGDYWRGNWGPYCYSYPWGTALGTFVGTLPLDAALVYTANSYNDNNDDGDDDSSDYGNANVNNYYYDQGIYYQQASDGSYQVTQPPTGVQVEQLPEGLLPLAVNGTQYYYYFGTYYIHDDTNDKYQVVSAPVDAIVPYIPDGFKNEEVDGKTVLQVNDTYYVPEQDQDSGSTVFQVVDPSTL